jgi:uncharacterized protein YjiS (DUF1127 family)
MHTSGTAGAGRTAATLLRPADRPAVDTQHPRRTLARLVGGALRRLGSMLKGLRRRRRPSLQSWMSMDPRLLADIGVRRADVQAVLYAGVPIERLGARRPEPSTGTVARTCPRTPQLQLVAADDLDEAA